MPVWMVTGAKLKSSYSLDHCWRPAVKYGLMCKYVYTVRVSSCKFVYVCKFRGTVTTYEWVQAYKCQRNVVCALRG